MQQYAGIYLLQNYSTCFGCPSHPSSGVHRIVTAASVQVIVSEQQTSSDVAYRSRSHVGGRLLLRYYDLYHRLQLQFYVIPMMGAMDSRNMQSNFAVNKYLYTVASCWILLIQSYDARNHAFKIHSRILSQRYALSEKIPRSQNLFDYVCSYIT